jgi:hypothetical protein
VPKWLLPWLFPLGLLLVVVAIAASTILAVVLAVVAGLVGVPLVYRAYQANRPGRPDGDGAKPRRADPPNNRSLLR